MTAAFQPTLEMAALADLIKVSDGTCGTCSAAATRLPRCAR